MKGNRILAATLLGAALFVAGMGAERALRGGARRADLAARARVLEAENRALAADLAAARTAPAGDGLASVASGAGAREAAWRSPGERAAAPRDAEALRAELADAFAAKDGAAVLSLLAELAALGPAHHGELAGHWIRLVNLDAAALDALGLSRIALASALAGEEGLMRFALGTTELDPVFRQFTADTLEQASVATRMAILDELDFSGEKDKRVLSALLRAVEDVKDAGYVGRFEDLVRRTDLYNDTRGRIAFLMAEIPGEESRRAIDELYVAGGYERLLPVLESLHAPPATGLLITNAMAAAPDRIGLYDVLLEYDGHRIRTRADLTLADAAKKPGDVVVVKVLRNGAEEILHVLVTDTAPGHLHFDAHPIVAR